MCCDDQLCCYSEPRFLRVNTNNDDEEFLLITMIVAASISAMLLLAIIGIICKKCVIGKGAKSENATLPPEYHGYPVNMVVPAPIYQFPNHSMTESENNYGQHGLNASAPESQNLYANQAHLPGFYNDQQTAVTPVILSPPEYPTVSHSL